MHPNVRGYWVRPLASHVWSEGNSTTAEAWAPSLLAEMGSSDLGAFSVAFTSQGEVLNPSISEYPSWWPVFHRAEASFMGLIKGLTYRQHKTTLSYLGSARWPTMNCKCIKDTICQIITHKPAFLDRKLYFITISLFIIPAGYGAMMNKGKCGRQKYILKARVEHLVHNPRIFWGFKTKINPQQKSTPCISVDFV